ncbi:DEAD/DEAH box helicase [Caldimonas brevitalea]|uniref:Superfamily I DNA/RNA helicase protein n=1 Tax=Caldimonas brevitalea TaxID=413882 RepID=A0A0G3BDC4_9BURK|nr:AAA domain-containing protein [Caldimonas brevitalea]AKJ27287.1 superfamily I DNA/RNA helicase protein [Caldimonas brevitalea]
MAAIAVATHALISSTQEPLKQGHFHGADTNRHISLDPSLYRYGLVQAVSPNPPDSKLVVAAAIEPGTRMDRARADEILNYWQAIEHLQPAVAPAHNPEKFCWSVRNEQDLPWVDGSKRRHLRVPPGAKFRWEFVIYAGLLDMKRLSQRLCELLDVDPPDAERDRSTEPAAVLALQVDWDGIVSSKPSLSGLPWAVSRIKAASAGAPLNFDGFSGEDGFERSTIQRLKDLLTERQVRPVTPQEPLASSDRGASASGSNAEIETNGDSTERCPTTFADIEALLDLALRETRCAQEFPVKEVARVEATRVSLRRDADEPEPQAILNSFYLQDLLLVRQAWASDAVGAGLRQYMAGGHSGDRVDVVHDDDGEVAVEGTLPRYLPAGCWPSSHPMVLAQQFAVNTLSRELFGTCGIFSVNGPPGTGKTTMLRDVVALLVVERAKVLAAFSSPANGFDGAGAPVRGEKPGKMYPLDARLHGFGMVVACLNNGAAQNVTRELPAAKSVDAPDVKIDYFAAVAETLLAGAKDKERRRGSAWGLIAAVLGNSELRNHFVTRFWFAGGGQRSMQDQRGEPDSEFVSFRSVLEAGVPGARPWREQCRTFKAALERSEAALRQRQQLADVLAEVEELRQEANAAEALHRKIQQALQTQQGELETARGLEVASRERLGLADAARAKAKDLGQAIARRRDHMKKMPAVANTQASDWDSHRAGDALADLRAMAALHSRAIDEIDRRRPGALARFFNTRGFRIWSKDRAQAVEKCLHIEMSIIQFARWVEEFGSLDQQLRVAEDALDVAADAFDLQRYLDAHEAAHREVAACESQVARLREEVQALEQAAGASARKRAEAISGRDRAEAVIHNSGFDASTLAGWQLASHTERERQTCAPWSDAALQKLRHEVFVEAIELHKSFIARNAEVVKKNLSHLMDLLQGKLVPANVCAGVGHLWECLFLCVPVVSTTFASMGTVFRGMDRESLGWVFIDEAGQAPPQAAAGALWRAKRALVVGDPLQLEPVVTVPAQVVDALEDRLGLPATWNPRLASAQVLADRANRYGTVIDGEWVGSPLRVHRRCVDPMFSISNAISYDGLMEYGTLIGKDEQDRQWLGESCWIDVPSRSGGGHWVSVQGSVAIEVVKQVLSLAYVNRQVFDEDGRAHVYLIAPFKDVAAGAKEMWNRAGIPNVKDACGTIHTFQGKEADVVVLLLGGDLARPGAISGFAAAKPNLLNVALTRAKRRVYVVGEHEQWRRHRFFSLLADRLPVMTPEQLLGGGELLGRAEGRVPVQMPGVKQMVGQPRPWS